MATLINNSKYASACFVATYALLQNAIRHGNNEPVQEYEAKLVRSYPSSVHISELSHFEIVIDHINAVCVSARGRQGQGDMLTLTSRMPDNIRGFIRDCQTEDNWNDDDAIGITVHACDVAIQFLESVMERNASVKTPEISPSVFGSVTFHWQKGDKHLVVRPSPDADMAYYRYARLGHISIYGDEPKEQVIQRVLEFFRSKNAEQD
jgi:hypothetical protein